MIRFLILALLLTVALLTSLPAAGRERAIEQIPELTNTMITVPTALVTRTSSGPKT